MADLGRAGEEAWGLLRQHLEWGEGTWWGWLFVASERDLRAVAGRLAELPDWHARVEVVELGDEDEVMNRLLATPRAERRLVFVLAQDPAGLPAWERLHLRLNERRERLRRGVDGVVLLAGRPEWKAATRAAAPDLWSQRVCVLEWDPLGAGEIRLPTRLESMPIEGVPDEALARRALARATAAGDTHGVVEAQIRLTVALLLLGRPLEALETADAAVAGAKEPLQHARARGARASARSQVGNLQAAVDDLRAAAADELDLDRKALALANLGLTLVRLGRTKESIRPLQEAVKHASSLPARANAITALGVAYTQLGRVRKGRTLLAALRAELRDGTEPFLLAQSLSLLCAVEADMGDSKAARASLDELSALLPRLPSWYQDDSSRAVAELRARIDAAGSP